MVGAVVDQMQDDIRQALVLRLAAHIAVGQRSAQALVVVLAQQLTPAPYAIGEEAGQRWALGGRFGVQAAERRGFAAGARQPQAVGYRQMVEGAVQAAEVQPARRAVGLRIQRLQARQQAVVGLAVVGQQALQLAGEQAIIGRRGQTDCA